MAMPQAAKRWTAEEVRNIPDDGNRYEVVDGELLVSPSPRGRHQQAVLQIALRLSEYLKGKRLAQVTIAPWDVEFDFESMVQPDVLVYRGLRTEWHEVGQDVLLAVEILSRSTARADRTIKRSKYQRVGVPEYWIVDVDGQVVERWRPSDDRPEILDERIEWQPAPQHTPMAIDLPALFRGIVEGSS